MHPLLQLIFGATEEEKVVASSAVNHLHHLPHEMDKLHLDALKKRMQQCREAAVFTPGAPQGDNFVISWATESEEGNIAFDRHLGKWAKVQPGFDGWVHSYRLTSGAGVGYEQIPQLTVHYKSPTECAAALMAVQSEITSFAKTNELSPCVSTFDRISRVHLLAFPELIVHARALGVGYHYDFRRPVVIPKPE